MTSKIKILTAFQLCQAIMYNEYRHNVLIQLAMAAHACNSITLKEICTMHSKLHRKLMSQKPKLI